MAKVIYRILESDNKEVTFFDEITLRSGTRKEMVEYFRDLASRARKMGLLISDGIAASGIIWMKAFTKGKTSIRRYELYV